MVVIPVSMSVHEQLEVCPLGACRLTVSMNNQFPVICENS